MQKECSLMPLAIIKIHIQQVNPQGDQHSHDCRTIPLGHCFFLRWKLVITQSIYTLKLKIAHSGPENLSGDTTAYITTHEHLIKYLDVVWGVANCNSTENSCLSCIRPTISAAKFRLSRILRQPARFKRNLLNINCSTTLHCGGFD